MAISNAEKFLVPALPFLLGGAGPRGRSRQVTAVEDLVAVTKNKWRRLYKPEALVGRGSQNIPLLAAACGLGVTFEQDDDLHQEILDGWLGYSKQPWWALEPATRNVYGSWITTSILVARAFAEKAGRDDVQVALRKLLRSTLTILTLGAGWRKERGKFPGYPVTLCGSRSTVTSKRATPDGRSRRDENGRAFRPNFIFGHPLNGLLQSLLEDTSLDDWEGEVLSACHSKTGVNPRAVLLAEEQDLLHRLIEARAPADVVEEDLETVKSWLEESPRPRPPLHLIRTVEGSATVCRRGVNPGSTNPMYAYVWWADERPATSPLRFYDWAGENTRVDCLYVDDPGTRSKGKFGVAEVDMEQRTVKAQRQRAEDFFDDEDLKFKPGWKEISLPGGEVLWHLRLTRKKVRIMPI